MRARRLALVALAVALTGCGTLTNRAWTTPAERGELVDAAVDGDGRLWLVVRDGYQVLVFAAPPGAGRAAPVEVELSGGEQLPDALRATGPYEPPRLGQLELWRWGGRVTLHDPATGQQRVVRMPQPDAGYYALAVVQTPFTLIGDALFLGVAAPIGALATGLVAHVIYLQGYFK